LQKIQKELVDSKQSSLENIGKIFEKSRKENQNILSVK